LASTGPAESVRSLKWEWEWEVKEMSRGVVVLVLLLLPLQKRDGGAGHVKYWIPLRAPGGTW
jgi:hypothetical protein